MLAINKFWLKVCHYLSFAPTDPLSPFFPVSSMDISGLLCPLASAHAEPQYEFGEGRTAKSEYLFHRLFPAKLPQIYPIPRSKITIFPITTTYRIPPFWPQCYNSFFAVTTLRIL